LKGPYPPPKDTIPINDTDPGVIKSLITVKVTFYSEKLLFKDANIN